MYCGQTMEIELKNLYHGTVALGMAILATVETLEYRDSKCVQKPQPQAGSFSSSIVTATSKPSTLDFTAPAAIFYKWTRLGGYDLCHRGHSIQTSIQFGYIVPPAIQC